MEGDTTMAGKVSKLWLRLPVLPVLVVLGLLAALAAERSGDRPIGPFDSAAPIADGDQLAPTIVPEDFFFDELIPDEIVSGVIGDRWMTGGGFTVAQDPVLLKSTRGFVVRCDVDTKLGINLEVNWGKGNKFHTERLTWAYCYDDPAIPSADPPPETGWDSFAGKGIGRYNGVAGATIDFLFTDHGEPGRPDTANILVKDPSGTVLLATGTMLGGNNQAHTQGPR